MAIKPTNLTFEQAAAVPVAAITALQGLRDVAGLRPGQSVLINGASGGVGTFAVQIAKALGGHVTGVCSLFVNHRLRSFVASGGHDDLEAFPDLIEAGAVTPAIERTYALFDTKEAIRYFGEGHARAKLVITMEP